jgi:multidrug efflux system outer membrane protein
MHKANQIMRRVASTLALKTLTLGTLTLSTLSLSACSLAPVYQQTAAPLPATYPLQDGKITMAAAATTTTTTTMDATSQPDWSSFIQAPQLRVLVQSALTHNHDLRQALLNIDASRAQYRIQRAGQLPTLDATGAAQRQRIPAALSPNGSGGVQSTYHAEITLNAFELDLFGRAQNLSTAALQDYLATEQAARSVRISLIARVSSAYVRYSASQARNTLAQQVLDARQQSLELIRLRRTAGAAGEMELQDAIGLVEYATAESLSAQRESEQARNTLQRLVGTPGLDATLTPASTQEVLFQDVSAGLPAELLTQRPDIIAAEHHIQARNADIGVARAAFFPHITLTGAYGSASPALADLFSSDTRTWQFMPQITLPIFSGARNQANLELAQLRKEASIIQYEEAIQTAFTEVANALTARATLRQQMAAQERLVASSAQTLKLAELRYRSGVDSQLRYLDTQRQEHTNRLALLDTWSALQNSRIALYKALGGSERIVRQPASP